MEDWEFNDLWEEDSQEDYQHYLYYLAAELADSFFLSDNGYSPAEMDDYSLGYLEAEDWWGLLNQLTELVDLEGILELASDLDGILGLPGLPSELLEAPVDFLESVLDGDLPTGPSGRRVGSRRLVKIAQGVVAILRELPETAQAAVRAWADVHRGLMKPELFDRFPGDPLVDLLADTDLPPAMTGFSMMIALTLMRWPDRAEGLPLPRDFAEPETFDEVLAQWEHLPHNPAVTEEGTGEAEALFAQGQLAHTLARMGTVELLSPDEDVEVEDASVAYSRLSRAILWVHNQCRRCPERDGVACKVATGWGERPVPLLDVASEIANTSRVAGCIKWD
jgi:hypothetical protein